MPNQFDGGAGPAGGQVQQADEAQRKKCKWSNCEGHEKDLDAEYLKGNVARQGQKLRENLLAKQLEPWNGGGHGETNIRKMYLDQRSDGVITLKGETSPYRIEAHHILPVETVESTSTLKDNAVLAGWDINHISNGMLMPKDEMDVALHLLQQHNGSHPGSYTGPVGAALSEIEDAYQDACQGKEDVAIQLALAQALEVVSNSVRGKILGIRQHASGVDYLGLHLDSLTVFRNAVHTLEERRQRYMEQQRQQILKNTQSKTQ
ncbi:AHH domain-containing protein [Myxococcus sp. RHSTA-1-4]|uniref:AHH domain-containing protein n=1 Tax=Myxococcus sp. RHSTA-1-4 TaxID=2874601 RepID=UPI001CBB0BF7|nr:AHH domain-containing protein [Myxococcus sp. RHSTA-1-4]MBZ4421356.1 AHH domain-containing protein [Myxococcus sp. RHSTA-1-4]